jgi:DNA-binding response OmpR family regulator
MNPLTARVLLIEDDSSIRRFVSMALESLPLRLIEASTLAEAREQLVPGDIALLIVDLMLPDGNGLDFLAELRSHAFGKAPPRAIVFSAGVTASMRESAAALGVWCVLDKPVALSRLLSAVRDALASEQPLRAQGEPVRPSASPHDAPASRNDLTPAHSAETGKRREAAIQEHFAGQSALFHAFLETALAQFPRDIASVDAAFEREDLAALRREAHNLKSVLRLIGEEAMSVQAEHVEQAAASASAEAGALRMAWVPLRAGLESLHL